MSINPIEIPKNPSFSQMQKMQFEITKRMNVFFEMVAVGTGSSYGDFMFSERNAKLTLPIIRGGILLKEYESPDIEFTHSTSFTVNFYEPADIIIYGIAQFAIVGGRLMLGINAKSRAWDFYNEGDDSEYPIYLRYLTKEGVVLGQTEVPFMVRGIAGSNSDTIQTTGIINAGAAPPAGTENVWVYAGNVGEEESNAVMIY